jgi:hypothetical protein
MKQTGTFLRRGKTPSFWTRIVPFVILLSAIMACSLSQSGATPTGEPAAEQAATARPTVPPSPTPVPEIEGGEVVVVPEIVVPPMDYMEVLEVKVASGEWTYEEGLVTLLKTFAGELSPSEVLGDDQPLAVEMGGVVESAYEYLETGTDAAVKEEVQRLLDALLPSADRLLPYATQQPASSRSPAPSVYLASSGSASPSLQDTQCEQLWREGFPAGESITCVQYTEVSLPDGTGRVFYPADWWPSGENMPYAMAASEALAHAAQVFSQFGATRSVDMVFAGLNSTDERAPLAISPVRGNETCLVVMYPSSITSAERTGMDEFKQVVAHEIFHCFQQWNFPAMMTRGAYLANQWWVEGSAEYFSNVAYPTVNAEYDWVQSFNRVSAVKPIYDMQYQNTTLFQYLANEISDQGLVDFFKSIPYSKDAQTSIAALAGLGDFQNTFHEFSEAWADKAIVDSGGGILPTEIVIPSSNREEVTEDRVINFTAVPFLLGRYLVKYKTDNVYKVSNSTSGTAGNDSARLVGAPHSWDSPPSEVSGNCGESPYIYITTSGVQTVQPHLLDADIDAELSHEEDPDCCVMGTWQLDKQQFALNMIDPGPQLAGIMTAELSSVLGDLRLEFRKNGQYNAEIDGLTINYRFSSVTDAQGNPMWVDSVVSYNGQVLGTFQTKGPEGSKALTGAPLLTTGTMSQSMLGGGGDPQEFSSIRGVLPSGENQPYTCEEDTLTFTYTDPVTEATYQNVYKRIEKAP